MVGKVSCHHGQESTLGDNSRERPGLAPACAAVSEGLENSSSLPALARSPITADLHVFKDRTLIVKPRQQRSSELLESHVIRVPWLTHLIHEKLRQEDGEF